MNHFADLGQVLSPLLGALVEGLVQLEGRGVVFSSKFIVLVELGFAEGLEVVVFEALMSQSNGITQYTENN